MSAVLEGTGFATEAIDGVIGVEEIVDVEVISVVEIGRIVHMLREEQRWTSGAGSYPGYRTKVSTGRRFTEDQIRLVLGLTTAELDEYQQTYLGTFRKWPADTMLDAVVAFAKRERRWPTSKDFASDISLPASSTWNSNRGQVRLNTWLRDPKNVRSLHPQLLLGIRNIEIRQQAIEAAGGIEKLIRKGAAKKLQSDQYGTLWEMPPEPGIVEKKAIWLEVVNATVEANGEAEHFFLRVPATMTTAKEAVEWSFLIPTGELEEFAAET